MGGVDTLSRVIIPYSIQRKGLKWYRKIGELFLDFAIYNSFVVWKKLNPASKDDHLKFRINLIKDIITHHLNMQPNADPGPGEPIIAAHNHNPLRLIERHFPAKKNQAVNRKKSRCVRCNIMGIRKEVIYECRQCNVALCVVPCFEIYHTRRNIADSDVDSDDDSDSSVE